MSSDSKPRGSFDYVARQKDGSARGVGPSGLSHDDTPVGPRGNANNPDDGAYSDDFEDYR